MRHTRATIRQVERLDIMAPRALRLALAQQPMSNGKVLFAWALVAGPALSRSAAASWRDGVLSLDAKSETWRRELVHARPVLLARMKELLGPDIVRTLQISGGDRPARR
jgi:predicted nucleic acid-binding Zn ribbon protein